MPRIKKHFLKARRWGRDGPNRSIKRHEQETGLVSSATVLRRVQLSWNSNVYRLIYDLGANNPGPRFALSRIMATLSVAELLAKGMAIQPGEAVAITQELTAHFASDPSTTPRACGPLSMDTVELAPDGSVSYSGPDLTLGLAEAALFLHSMLGSSVKVPGALRYTVARALREVDAPPFDSLADFSRTLARFEPSDRRAAVRALLERNASTSAGSETAANDPSQKRRVPPEVTVHVPPRPRRWPATQEPPAHDRRCVPPQVTALRRQLREADQRLFEQQVASRKPARIVRMPALSVVPASPASHTIPKAAPTAAAEAGGTTDSLGAPVPVVLSTSAGADANRAVARRDTMPWARALLVASGLAATLSLAAAGLSYLRQPAAPTTRTHADTAPLIAPSSAVAVSRPSEAPGVLGAGSSPVPLTGGPVAANTVPQARAAVTRPRRPATAAASLTSAITKISARESAEDHDEGLMVSALDLQQRPVFSPAFASKESAIFFHTGRDGDARSALKVATPADNASDLHVITVLDDGARNYHPQPSPDGQLVAFDSDRDGERGVYMVNRDGTNVRRVSGSGYAAVPSWSPDGRQLAYVRAEAENPKVWNLWLLSLDPDAPKARRLTHYSYGQLWAASWFSDGRRICYAHEDKIVVLDLVTGRSREFESPVKGRLVRTPAVSPDGTKVIFQVFRRGGWLLDLETGSMQNVLADPSAEEFAWSPTGRRIAYHSRRDGAWGIYVYGGD